MPKTFSTQALVLKRVNTGEYDRIVTLLTPDYGKLQCVAKGVRRLTSTQRAFLEPGNHITAYFVRTSSLALLTQTKLVTDVAHVRTTLKSLKQLAEVLEIVDRLFPEEVEEPELFAQIIGIINHLNTPGSSFTAIKDQLARVLQQLGYQDIAETNYTSILDYVSAVADRPMHSYDYLTVTEVTP